MNNVIESSSNIEPFGEPLMSDLSIHQKINLKMYKGMYLVFSNLPSDLIQENGYGVPCSDWYEPIETKDQLLLLKYSHIPFESAIMGSKRPLVGIVCDGQNWYRIKGYKEPNYAPGVFWEDEKFNQNNHNG